MYYVIHNFPCNVNAAHERRITAFSKSKLYCSEGACSPRPKSLLAVAETLTALAYGASGDNFRFVNLL
jgi:hypothetical protein